MCRILPSSLSCTSAPSDSASGTRVGPVELVQRNLVQPQPLQAALARRAQVLGPAVGVPAARTRPDQAALGSDDEVVGIGVQGLGDQPLATSGP